MSALSENLALKIPAYQAIFALVYMRKKLGEKIPAKRDIRVNQQWG